MPTADGVSTGRRVEEREEGSIRYQWIFILFGNGCIPETGRILPASNSNGGTESAGVFCMKWKRNDNVITGCIPIIINNIINSNINSCKISNINTPNIIKWLLYQFFFEKSSKKYCESTGDLINDDDKTYSI